MDEGGLAFGEPEALAITTRNPAVSRHSEEELAVSPEYRVRPAPLRHGSS